MAPWVSQVSKFLSGSVEACASGCFVNTMGWVEDLGYALLLDTIQAFEADVILVIGQVTSAQSLPSLVAESHVRNLQRGKTRHQLSTACDKSS